MAGVPSLLQLSRSVPLMSRTGRLSLIKGLQELERLYGHEPAIWRIGETLEGSLKELEARNHNGKEN